MAYVPPHLRHNKGGASSPLSPARPPESMIPRFQRNPDLKPEKPHTKAVHAENAISKWFVAGLTDENRVSSLARLEPVAMESSEWKPGDKPLSLMLKENGEEATEFSENPWIGVDSVVEAVKQDLFASFEQVKNEMRSDEFHDIRPNLVLRVGRILFHGSRSFTTESMKGSSLPVSTLKQLRKSFYTNVPPSYMENITSNVVPQTDWDFEKENESYHVKLFDNMRPDATISCKCTFVKDRNQLEHSKIELKHARHLVADMSCLDKDLDLRLMLTTRRILVALTDEELKSIKSLISSAILDSEVKGGLRWSLGKKYADNRFSVVGVWHTNVKKHINSSMKLYLRHADRFDFPTSSGEAANEVVVKLTGIVSLLQEDEVNTELVLEMLGDNLRQIWKHFLSCV